MDIGACDEIGFYKALHIAFHDSMN